MRLAPAVLDSLGLLLLRVGSNVALPDTCGYSISVQDSSTIVDTIRRSLPAVQVVYLFGSQATGEATSTSDIDLAVLQPGKIDSLLRWRVAEELASQLGRTVDLVDLRAASTVMRAQVLASGEIIYDGDPGARALFEALTLSDYTRLNEERRGIIEDARARGTIYG